MQELQLSAGTLEYEDSGGDGPVLVLTHGLVMDGSVWRDVVADLRSDYRCVLPTLPLGAHRRPMREDAQLRGFERPALVAWAAEDRIMPREHGRRLAELLPLGRLVEIEDSYTLIPQDQPAALARRIREFVEATR